MHWSSYGRSCWPLLSNTDRAGSPRADQLPILRGSLYNVKTARELQQTTGIMGGPRSLSKGGSRAGCAKKQVAEKIREKKVPAASPRKTEICALSLQGSHASATRGKEGDAIPTTLQLLATAVTQSSPLPLASRPPLG